MAVKTSKTLVIDGNYYLERALQVSKERKAAETNVVFLTSVHSDVSKIKPDRVIVVLDSKKSWRKDLVNSYSTKTNILGESSVKELKTLCSNAGIPALQVPNYEVPDLMASLCKAVPGQVVLSSNRIEVLQLVRQRILVWLPANHQLVRKDLVRSICKVKAEQVKDFLMLTGHACMGVEGIMPEENALSFLSQYDSLDKMKTIPRLEDKLKSRKARLLLADKILTLRNDYPVSKDQTIMRQPLASNLTETELAASNKVFSVLENM